MCLNENILHTMRIFRWEYLKYLDENIQNENIKHTKTYLLFVTNIRTLLPYFMLWVALTNYPSKMLWHYLSDQKKF